MNVKLHTPQTLKAGSGMSSGKQFLLSLIATTVSIILTFGTAAIVDNHKKNAAKREMVMMIISDFDRTIEHLRRVDTVLTQASELQQHLAVHPEHFDSLSMMIIPVMEMSFEEFSETTEKIFTSSIETFNTIGDANFVNEVSSFYIMRRHSREMLIDRLKGDIEGKMLLISLDSLLTVDFPEYAYLNWTFMYEMKEKRDKCMLMMHVSEDDMERFTEQHVSDVVNPEKEAMYEQKQKEYIEAQSVIMQAREKLGL